MAPWLLMAIPAAMGMISGMMQQKRQEEVEGQTRAERAAAIRASPWLNTSIPQVQYAGSAVGNVLAGAGSGMAMGQNLMGAFGASQKSQDNRQDYLERQKAFQEKMSPEQYQMPAYYNPWGMQS